MLDMVVTVIPDADTPPVLPVLRPLVFDADAAPSRPVVVADLEIAVLTLGREFPEPDADQGIIGLVPHTEGTISELLPEAMDNLIARGLLWATFVPDNPPPDYVEVMECDYDQFCAEMIFDPEHLHIAQAHFKTKRLALGIPCNGQLLATSADASDEQLARFASSIAMRFLTAERPITPLVIYATDGCLDGIFSGSEDALKAARAELAANPPEVENPIEGRFTSAKVQQRDGRYSVLMTGGVVDPADLRQGLMSVCFDVVDGHGQDPQFNNEVVFELDPAMTPDTPDVRAMLAALPAEAIAEHDWYWSLSRDSDEDPPPTISFAIGPPAQRSGWFRRGRRP